MGFGANRNDGPPAWFVMVVAVAVVFGGYYLWTGFQDFVRSGGQGRAESATQAIVVASATAERIQEIQAQRPTLPPSLTPLPECQDFIVIVPNARVRDRASTAGATIGSFFENDVVCVLGRAAEGSEWYVIDDDPSTRRINIAYMHESVLRALNPTPTPSDTATPAPTVTLTPSEIPSETPIPQPTPTRDPATPDTPTPTLTPTPTEPMVNV